MKQLLGTINVYVDNEETEQTSSCAAMKLGADGWPNEFDIVLNPKGSVLPGGPQLPQQALMQSLMAHELGHAVALLTKSTNQHPAVRSLEGDLPCEIDAWKIGAMIAPVDSEFKESCLDSYRFKDMLTEPGRNALRAKLPELLPLLPEKAKAKYDELFKK